MPYASSGRGTSVVIEGKAAIGTFCVLLGIALTSYGPLKAASRRNFRLAVLGLWAATRFGLFTTVYGFLGFSPQSDINAYFSEGRAATAGLLVYRDFSSSYAPLFPYAIGAALKWVWASPKVIVLLAILAEGASLLLWMNIAERLLPLIDARRAALLYVASATPLVNVAVEGQNQVWVSALLAAAAWLYARERTGLAAVVLSVPTVLVKFLAAFALPAFASWHKRRVAFVAVFALLPAVVYGTLAASGTDILVPLKIQGTDQTSGGIPFLVQGVLVPFGVLVPPRIFDALTVTALGALWLWFLRKRPRVPAQAVLWALVMIITTLLISSKKAYASYLVMTFYPICALAAARVANWWRTAIFGIFSAAAMIERTLWFRWLGSRPLSEIFLHPTVGVWRPGVPVLVCTDLFLIASYAWLWNLGRTHLEALAETPKTAASH
ncbi:MAG: hypothetical protein ABSH50_18900 [Bryobacteraceae bacterium]|jgi:hypothetical protein